MTNITVLPLHPGKAPRWLFSRMVKLSGIISEAMMDEYGTTGFLNKLSDSRWFQALSCVIGYDWHSSGTTTVTVGALKEALNYNSDIFIAGGKGKQGNKSPEQIVEGADYLSIGNSAEDFKNKSRITAKIDSSLIYDGIGIYHHAFIFSKNKEWVVIQQGMHAESSNAVRFQISWDSIDKNDIANETNKEIVSKYHTNSFDISYSSNKNIREASVNALNSDLNKIVNSDSSIYKLPKRHEILSCDLSDRARSVLKYAGELKPEKYEDLLKVKGLGGRTLRSLAIISSLIYDEEIYKRDPIMYAYNVGGKDGIPFPISREGYDDVVKKMGEIVNSSKMKQPDADKAMKRLSGEMRSAYSITV
jgi:uncharacterized protein